MQLFMRLQSFAYILAGRRAYDRSAAPKPYKCRPYLSVDMIKMIPPIVPCTMLPGMQKIDTAPSLQASDSNIITGY